MGLKEYRGSAKPTTLVALISPTALSFEVADASGWPTGTGGKQFVVVLGRDSPTEETVLCDGRNGNVIAIAASGRGYDDTGAITHPAGEPAEHCIDAASMTDANAHVFDHSRDDHTQYLNADRHDDRVSHSTVDHDSLASRDGAGAHPQYLLSTLAAKGALVTGDAAGVAHSVTGGNPGDLVTVKGDGTLGFAAAVIASPANIPVGGLMAYAGALAPAGWLVCDGTAVSRSTYASLFTVLGTAYGAGDGTTTFNLPDLRQGVPVGAGTTSPTLAVGGVQGGWGSGTHTHGLTVGANTDVGSAHTHGSTLTMGAHSHGLSGSSGTESAQHTHQTAFANNGSNVTGNELATHAHSLAGLSTSTVTSTGTLGINTEAAHTHPMPTITVQNAAQVTPAAVGATWLIKSS